MKPMLILMPFGLPWHWSADYEKKTAEYLSISNCVVAFLISEGISCKNILREKPLTRHKTNMYVFRPIYLIPFQRLSIIKRINYFFAILQCNLLLRYLKPFSSYQKRVFWTFSLQYCVFPKDMYSRTLAVYDCIDGFVSNKKATQLLWNRYEKRILSESDAVIVNSSSLYRRMVKRHPTVLQTSEGLFDLDSFQKASLVEQGDIRHIPHPRILFVGNISSRMNLPFLRELIIATPQWSYVFAGHLDTGFDGNPHISFQTEWNNIIRYKNVFYLGSKQKTLIPSYIKNCDIGLIPYDASLKFNRLSSPMKIQEFFYFGKPVVALGIPETHALAPYIVSVKTVNGAKQQIQRVLRDGWPKSFRYQQKKIAQLNNISERVKTIISWIQKPPSLG